jgi:hypothetical protein
MKPLSGPLHRALVTEPRPREDQSPVLLIFISLSPPRGLNCPLPAANPPLLAASSAVIRFPR